ncbi:4'-phosphopantetheinyl transferase superfamily protein [Roseibium sp.]|uniref:4'-phosphopantetheinyl transferase family protein n=1 Tax=Roseibium sp. TaxID=1936156 RepID=UPI003BAEEB25
MALLSVVRHWHFLDQLSIQEISRRIGLTRNTKRKYLRTDTVEPVFKVPARPRKLEPSPTSCRTACAQGPPNRATQKRLSFLRIWCLKEAIFKAVGSGLSEDLAAIDLTASPDETVRPVFYRKNWWLARTFRNHHNPELPIATWP